MASVPLDPDSHPAPSPSVNVLYFAALRDLAGVGEERVHLPASSHSVEDLLRVLEQRHDALRGRLASIRVAVNEEFTELSRQLSGGEVVALIPPVSGG